MSAKRKNILQQRFGRLVAVKYLHTNEQRQCIWEFLCDCGNIHQASVANVVSGQTSSCGCYKKDQSTKHGLRDHPLYPSFYNMNSRCHNEANANYHHYGGRGIFVCDRWRGIESLNNFIDDMSSGWQEGLTLDRIDVNLGYSKENCRWANTSTQAHVKRKKKGCSSAYIGVTFRRDTCKWQASVKIAGKAKHLGMFLDELSAAKAYDNASEKLYGDRPNKTDKGEINA